MHFSTQTHTQNMGQDNDSLSENVHNMMSGTLGQWVGKRIKKYMHFSTQIHTQNMGQDNNSQTENVHNMMSGTLGQWVGKSRNT